MRIDIITIFPEYFGPLRVSLIGKAAERGDIQFGVHDLRDWATDVHRSVDDSPYGGGPGMVMTPGPWGEALDSVLASGGAVIRQLQLHVRLRLHVRRQLRPCPHLQPHLHL